jgi:hypothetical protein
MEYSESSDQNKEKTVKPRGESMRFLVFLIIMMCSLPVGASELAGVTFNDSVKTDDGSSLMLNGAGIRSKFFMDIYVALLYLENPSTNVKDVLEKDQRTRIEMHFVYNEVTKDKLVDAWNEGFKENTAAVEIAKLQDRINTFNTCFGDMKKGDTVVVDYTPKIGTQVIIKGEKKATIQGRDFREALLKIWLGDKPVNAGLKDNLLGVKK